MTSLPAGDPPDTTTTTSLAVSHTGMKMSLLPSILAHTPDSGLFQMHPDETETIEITLMWANLRATDASKNAMNQMSCKLTEGGCAFHFVSLQP